jgi:allantoin racemase
VSAAPDEAGSRRILVVNVNTTAAMTRLIAEQAQASALPGTTIIPATPAFGPASVESILQSHLSAVGVLDRVLAEKSRYDAVVLAGFGELGREALQEAVEVPVVDITDAAAHFACLLGRSFSVVTTVDRAIPAIQDRLLLNGLHGRCASVRSTGLGVLDLEADPRATRDAITEVARKAVAEDRAEVICLGCAGMSGLADAVTESVGVPVVDGVPAAVRIAESLLDLGLRTSKVRTYAATPKSPVSGWPLSRPSQVEYKNDRAEGNQGVNAEG